MQKLTFHIMYIFRTNLIIIKEVTTSCTYLDFSHSLETWASLLPFILARLSCILQDCPDMFICVNARNACFNHLKTSISLLSKKCQKWDHLWVSSLNKEVLLRVFSRSWHFYFTNKSGETVYFLIVDLSSYIWSKKEAKWLLNITEREPCLKKRCSSGYWIWFWPEFMPHPYHHIDCSLRLRSHLYTLGWDGVVALTSQWARQFCPLHSTVSG